jgi:hypothetical protein
LDFEEMRSSDTQYSCSDLTCGCGGEDGKDAAGLLKCERREQMLYNQRLLLLLGEDEEEG